MYRGIDMERLQKQFDFILEIDKEKSIERQTYISDGSRKENDAEHAWHMALMCFLLSEHANESIDKLKTIMMLLIHDLVEIYAGDTFAYSNADIDEVHAKELKAADKLYSKLPKDQATYLKNLWIEFEEGKTAEARFAHTIDNIQPMMLNFATKGKAWTEHRVKISQVLKLNKNTSKGSDILWKYACQYFLRPSIKRERLINDIEL